MLSFDSVSITRPGGSLSEDVLFSNLTIAVSEGKGLGIIGPNGSGKSTLIKTIAGLLPLQSGAIRLSPTIRLGYMPQNYRSGVLSWLSLREHFELTLDDAGRHKAVSFLSDVGFAPDHDRKLANMSGGEVQIIILSTLIGQDCNLLLLDEPLSAIDFVRRGKAVLRLKQEMETSNRTLIIVSHHLEDAQLLCERLIVLSGKNGTPCKVLDAGDQIDLLKVFEP